MMNLLARIMSHGFALTVVALIAIGFMYRGELFPEWNLPAIQSIGDSPETTEDTESGTVNRIVPDAESGTVDAGTDMQSGSSTAGVGEDAPDSSTEQTATDLQARSSGMQTSSVSSPDSQEISPQDSGTDTGAVSRDTAMPPGIPASDTGFSGEDAAISPVPADIPEVVAWVTPEQQMNEAAASPSATTEISQPVERPVTEVIISPADEEVTEEVESTNTETVVDAIGEQVEAPAAEASTGAAAAQMSEPPLQTAWMGGKPSTPYQMLAAAREAFWLRDYVAAEERYQRLVQMEPDNPDGYGELGNLYFSQGKWEQAAAAYYEAGVRLLDDGLLVQANQLVDVIRGLNGTQADELENKIGSARSVTP